MTKQVLFNHAKAIVDQIVDEVAPRRVVLFGSAVDGRAGPDSDLDFLVVVADDCDVDKAMDRLNTRVRHRPLPCDFLVVRDASLRKHRNKPGLIYQEAVSRGKVMYAA